MLKVTVTFMPSIMECYYCSIGDDSDSNSDIQRTFKSTVGMKVTVTEVNVKVTVTFAYVIDLELGSLIGVSVTVTVTVTISIYPWRMKLKMLLLLLQLLLQLLFLSFTTVGLLPFYSTKEFIIVLLFCHCYSHCYLDKCSIYLEFGCYCVTVTIPFKITMDLEFI